MPSLVRAPLLLVALAACAHARPRGAYLLSSERSDYSPVVRLAVAVADAGDSVVVRVDSGMVVAPGAGRASVVMRDLRIEALLVTSPPPAADVTRAPWAPLAASAPQPLADSLLLGVAEPLPPMRFVVARPPGLDPKRSWVIFRIVGDAITTPVRYADGTTVASRPVEGGVRVFACADRSLAGRLDRRRAAALAVAYLSVC